VGYQGCQPWKSERPVGQLLVTDQRGRPHPDKEDKGGCDMGAYESQTR